MTQSANLKWPDFNGDAKSDILLCNYPNSWMGLSDGSGIFKSFIPAGSCPAVLVGDFNGDHLTDMTASSSIWDTLMAAPGLSNGYGGFVSAPQQQISETPASHTIFDVGAVADLNGDGKSDLLLYARNRGDAAIGISTGTTFSFTLTNFGAGYDIVRLADFNGDGIADLLLYERDTPRAFVGLNDGHGNFTFSWLWLSPGYDIIETADLNRDGAADLVLYNSLTGTAYIGLSDGEGGFQFTYHLWRNGCSRIRIGDLDGDGNPDLLLYSQNIGAADVGFGDGKGGFQFKNLYWGAGYDTVEVADFNGDGKADFLLYNAQTGTAYTAVSDGSAGLFTYNYHLWMPQLYVAKVEDSGQILSGPPILFEFDQNYQNVQGIPLFVAAITDPQSVRSLRSYIAHPDSQSRIVSGKVILSRALYNPNWSYHLQPDATASLGGGTPGGCDAPFSAPEQNPLYWTSNETFLCATVFANQIREIGPLRP